MIPSYLYNIDAMETNHEPNFYLFADIGNSTIDFLSFDEEKRETKKIDTHNRESILSYLSEFNNKKNLSITISSVNSDGLNAIMDFLSSYQGEKRIFLLSPESRKSYAESNHLKVDNVSFLGSDLFCDIIAEENKNGQIIIDLGTASKILYLSKDNVFYGCSIFPGLSSFPRTLNRTTDLLERVNLRSTPKLVSLETKECISSGAINGGASLIAGMVNARKREYGCKDADVYLTGGNAYLVKDNLSRFELTGFTYDPYHIRKGLRRLTPPKSYEKLIQRRK